MLGERRPYVRSSAVAVVGQRLDDDRDTGRPVALVAHLGVILAPCPAGRLLDRPINRVLRHVRLPRRHHRRAQPRVGGGIGHALTGGDRDLADQSGELPAAARILGALPVHDVLELGMSGHRSRGQCSKLSCSVAQSTPTAHEEARVTDAPGWPGIAPRWTSSAKSGIGTALSPVSRVWFTLSHGILDEIYYPRVDQACTRDFGFIVTDGAGFFAEEKRDCTFDLSRLEDGVPAFQLVSTHEGGRFRIIKYVLTDPRADVVVQRVRLEILSGPPLRLFALLAPHLVNGGAHNTGWIGDYKGHRLLFAEGDGTCLALGGSRPYVAASVGFVGTSDGWQMLHATGSLTEQYRPRRRRQRRPDRRNRRAGNRVPARPRLWPQCTRGRVPRAHQPADAIQCAA